VKVHASYIGGRWQNTDGLEVRDISLSDHGASQIFRFFSGEALRMTGERQASTREKVSITLHREPVGVVSYRG
jgi:acyl-CoA reductase-like NAD-dependent aldehyde dehydrogenase